MDGRSDSPLKMRYLAAIAAAASLLMLAMPMSGVMGRLGDCWRGHRLIPHRQRPAAVATTVPAALAGERPDASKPPITNAPATQAATSAAILPWQADVNRNAGGLAKGAVAAALLGTTGLESKPGAVAIEDGSCTSRAGCGHDKTSRAVVIDGRSDRTYGDSEQWGGRAEQGARQPMEGRRAER